MIHNRANELMHMLSAAPHDEVDSVISDKCSYLRDKDAALMLTELRIMHDKHKDSDILYPAPFQIAIEMAILELDIEMSPIQLDVSAND